jgi:hypothetical protein
MLIMNLSINVLITYIMHFFGLFYDFLEKYMGITFDDLTSTQGTTTTEAADG